MVTKIVLIVEYDGTRYHGFQWQKQASTIQAELEKAVGKLSGEAVRVVGASRTDAGTHAKGQVVSFRTGREFPMATWVKGLNAYLPVDIAVKGASEARDSFDVRREATRREYAYYILNSPARSPLQERYTYLVPRSLDVGAMGEAWWRVV